MAKKLAEVRLNHLEFDVGNRGKWRKFNPYNPYVEGQEEKAKDLKVESLDDLFDEDDKNEENKKEENTANNSLNNPVEPNARHEQKIQEDAPILPQSSENEEESSKVEEDEILSIDVQKELEAKFDELFRKL